MCDCEEFYQSDLEEKTLNLVNGQQTFLISPNRLGSGQYGDVYHAFWPHYGICVALKEFNESNKAKSEIKVLARINDADDHIIQMHGYQKYPRTIIVMELGGMNFDNYFSTEILHEGQEYSANDHEVILTDMLLCAARALGQFHKYGIHMDVKGINFITIKGQESWGKMHLCKIIDFNSSFITDNEEVVEVEKKDIIGTGLYMPPEIKKQHHTIGLTRKIDIYAFGVTIYKFLFSPHAELRNLYPDSLNYHGRLGKLAKACLRKDPRARPEIEEVICFLMNECDEI